MRYKGVPDRLHRDLATKQKTDKILELNRKMMIKDSYSKAENPNQNPPCVLQRFPFLTNHLQQIQGRYAHFGITGFATIKEKHNFTNKMYISRKIAARTRRHMFKQVNIRCQEPNST